MAKSFHRSPQAHLFPTEETTDGAWETSQPCSAAHMWRGRTGHHHPGRSSSFMRRSASWDRSTWRHLTLSPMAKSTGFGSMESEGKTAGTSCMGMECQPARTEIGLPDRKSVV